MKHARPPKAVIALVLVLLLAGGGWYWWSSTRPAETPPVATGTVDAREYQVASVLGGRVVEVKVAEGDMVEAGDALVVLDDAALKVQLAQAEDAVTAAEAGVTLAKRGTAADRTAAQARLDQARAGVQLAKIQLTYATITAPNGGIVVAVTTNAGQSAAPGRTLVTLMDPDSLYVRVFVPASRVAALRVGDEARVTTDASDATFTGTVSFIASEAAFVPNNVETKEQRARLVFEVRLDVVDETDLLKPGLPVDVSFS